MITDLTLSFVYDHPLAGAWSLYDLKQFQGVIGPENLDSAGWWMAHGGLQIFRDRIFRFFDQRQAPLSAYVVFVLQSLFPHQPLPLPQLKPAQHTSTDSNLIALLGLPDHSRLILREQDSAFTLAYLPATGTTHKLTRPFFAERSIAPTAWKTAAYQAVDEYMTVVETCIEQPSGQLQALLSWWQQHALEVQP